MSWRFVAGALALLFIVGVSALTGMAGASVALQRPSHDLILASTSSKLAASYAADPRGTEPELVPLEPRIIEEVAKDREVPAAPARVPPYLPGQGTPTSTAEPPTPTPPG